MPSSMRTRTKSRRAGALIAVVLTAGLGGVARAETDGRFSVSYDAGLMHSTAVHVLPTQPSGIAGPGAGLVALPYFGVSGIVEYANWVAGVRGDVALGVIDGPDHGFFGTFTGFRLAWGNWRLQATAELGEHLLSQIGEGQFQNTSDEFAVLPFAGATVELGHANGVRPGHLGLSGFIRQDLTQRPLSAMVRVQDPGEAVDFTFQANYTLGGTMVGLALNLTTN